MMTNKISDKAYNLVYYLVESASSQFDNVYLWRQDLEDYMFDNVYLWRQDLEDYIAELEAENEKLKQMARWRDVNIEPPEIGAYAFVSSGEDNGDCDYLLYEGDGMWSDWDGDMANYQYWMPEPKRTESPEVTE